MIESLLALAATAVWCLVLAAGLAIRRRLNRPRGHAACEHCGSRGGPDHWCAELAEVIYAPRPPWHAGWAIDDLPDCLDDLRGLAAKIERDRPVTFDREGGFRCTKP